MLLCSDDLSKIEDALREGQVRSSRKVYQAASLEWVGLSMLSTMSMLNLTPKQAGIFVPNLVRQSKLRNQMSHLAISSVFRGSNAFIRVRVYIKLKAKNRMLFLEDILLRGKEG